MNNFFIYLEHFAFQKLHFHFVNDYCDPLKGSDWHSSDRRQMIWEGTSPHNVEKSIDPLTPKRHNWAVSEVTSFVHEVVWPNLSRSFSKFMLVLFICYFLLKWLFCSCCGPSGNHWLQAAPSLKRHWPFLANSCLILCEWV